MLLSDEQMRLITWLEKIGQIEICLHRTSREYFANGLEEYNGHFNIRSLNKLKSLGLVKSEPIKHFDVDWLRHELTALGKRYLKNNGVDNHARNPSAR